MKTFLIVYGLFAIFWFLFMNRTTNSRKATDILAQIALSLLWGIVIPIMVYGIVVGTSKGLKEGEKKNERWK